MRESKHQSPVSDIVRHARADVPPAQGFLAGRLEQKLAAELARPYRRIRAHRVACAVWLLCLLRHAPAVRRERHAALALAARICGRPARRAPVMRRGGWQACLLRAACIGLLAGGLLCRVHCMNAVSAKTPAEADAVKTGTTAISRAGTAKQTAGTGLWKEGTAHANDNSENLRDDLHALLGIH